MSMKEFFKELDRKSDWGTGEVKNLYLKIFGKKPKKRYPMGKPLGSQDVKPKRQGFM